MTISRVQGQFQNDGVTVESSTSVTLSAVGSGNMLCVAAYWGLASSGDTATFSDNKSNTYTNVDTTVDGTNAFTLATGYCLNITNGPTVITVTFKNGGSPVNRQFCVAIAEEFSGVASFDKHTINEQTSLAAGTNVVTSGSVTPTANGELIYGITSPNGPAAASIAAGTGYTSGLSPYGAGFVTTEYEVQATAAAIAATFSPAGGSADNYITGIMTFTPLSTVCAHQLTLLGVGCGLDLGVSLRLASALWIGRKLRENPTTTRRRWLFPRGP